MEGPRASAKQSARRARASFSTAGFAPSVTVQKVTSAPKRRSRYARSTVQMLVVGHRLQSDRRSMSCTPRPRSSISTHARPQSLHDMACGAARGRPPPRCRHRPILTHSRRSQAKGPGPAGRRRAAHQLKHCRTWGTSCSVRTPLRTPPITASAPSAAVVVVADDAPHCCPLPARALQSAAASTCAVMGKRAGFCKFFDALTSVASHKRAA